MVILPGISECLLKSRALIARVFLNLPVRHLQRSEGDQPAVQPFPVGSLMRIGFFDLFIQQDSLLFCINQKEFSRMQPLLLQDMALGKVQNADLR